MPRGKYLEGKILDAVLKDVFASPFAAAQSGLPSYLQLSGSEAGKRYLAMQRLFLHGEGGVEKYYTLLKKYLPQLLPVVYTPVIGIICRWFGVWNDFVGGMLDPSEQQADLVSV